MDQDVFVFPLSLAQQRLWFLDRLVSGNSAYSLSWGARLRGVLDVGALERSLQTVIERHESLRTTFDEIDGEPVQVIAPRAARAPRDHRPDCRAELGRRRGRSKRTPRKKRAVHST